MRAHLRHVDRGTAEHRWGFTRCSDVISTHPARRAHHEGFQPWSSSWSSLYRLCRGSRSPTIP